MRKLIIVAIVVFLQVLVGANSLFAQNENITRQETLRGSVTPEREWWDLLHYHLSVEFLPETKRLRGSNVITFKTVKSGNKMQLDLQPPLAITKVTHGTSQLKFEREGNVYWVMFEKELPTGAEDKIEVFYEGVPVVSKNPPWVGGITWGRDDVGNHFIVTTCQGIGASIWWPNKDHGADEPDRGMQISVTVPDNLVAVSNGRLKKTDHDVAGKTKTFHWEVLNPINNYGINVNIGNYINFSEKYQGKGGVLDVDYWVLPHQKEAALRQFKEVRRTLEAFEHWFGKYPFYEDSYKLVTVSYPGMEHQSSVTYGNWFQNGYLRRDPCNCGVGMKFDFIIVHESAHEWFGNNISMKDAADMWIHEGFANYSENLFVEYHFGKKDAEDYVVGTRQGIRNDRPVIGVYKSNRQGSGDMYPKGGNMLHTIRQIINDDAKWLSILRGLNADFWHQTVTTEQVESYITSKAGIDLSKVFDQYLRTTKIPLLKYSLSGKTLSFNYERVVKGFAMPLRASVNGKEVVLTPTEVKQTREFPEEIKTFAVNRNFYIETEKGESGPATMSNESTKPRRDIDTLLKDIADHKRPSDSFELFSIVPTLRLYLELQGPLPAGIPRGEPIKILPGMEIKMSYVEIQNLRLIRAFTSDADPRLGNDYAMIEGREALEMVLKTNLDGLLIQSSGTAWAVLSRNQIEQILANLGNDLI